MKKLAIAAAAAAAMTAGVAHAYTTGTFSNGFVVPNVIHNGAANSTAVGVISNNATSVYWTFFDEDSKHITDGCFPMTANDYYPFVWANQSGVGLEGKRGYLVFAAAAAGTATACSTASTIVTGEVISGHAFEYDVAKSDVAFVPVIDGPLGISSGADLTTLDEDSLTSVAGAAPVGETLVMRYYIDGATGGDDTRIVVWSTGDQSTGDQSGSHTVNIYDDKQNRKSVNFDLVNEELDWFDPETIAGRPADFKDGFIVWNTANAAPTLAGSIFSYSVISAPAFGAVQTILNPHR